MSNTTENVLTKTYKGKFGNQMVYRNRAGVSIMAKMPKKSLKPVKDSQTETRRKFRMATRWAKNILLDPAVKAEYAALAKGMQTPYSMAVANYLSPPEVKQIIATAYDGTVGSKIKVVATDDFRVKEVTVKIADAAGALIEQGACVEDLSADCWVYTATVAVPVIAGLVITAEAKDVPDHTGTLEKTL